MRYLRKMFWATIASGALLFFNGFSKSPQALIASIKDLKDLQSNSKLPVDTAANHGSDGSSSRFDLPLESTTDSEFRERYEIFDNKKYVQIFGRYYEYREDHVYTVDGVKTFFLDNRRVDAGVAVQKPIAKNTIRTISYDRARNQLNRELENNESFTAEDTIQKLKSLQNVTRARDQYLDQIQVDGR